MREDQSGELPLRTPVSSGRDKEYTLSTGLVLGIFFALALICSVFFGFGYTLGRKSMQTATADGATGASGSTASFSTFKPAAGSISGGTAAPAAHVEQPAAPPTVLATQSAPADVTKPAVVVAETRTTPAAAETAAASTAATISPTMVQIAAVSHPEDAEVLTAALKRRGYNVVTHGEPGDKLIHVQVGPFPTRKDAEAMRQKLIADGYNAILK